MPWKCTLCSDEDAERYPSKDGAKEHVRNNHMMELVAASIEREEPDVDHGAIDARVFRES